MQGLPPSQSRPWVLAVLLAAPLVIVAGWLATGGLSRSFGPASAASGIEGPDGAPETFRLTGFPEPEQDLPADRLHERVNGAAETLRRSGCQRLLFWKLDQPGAELEVLEFDDPQGASETLARDAGRERTPGPGEESSVGDNAIFFRRGSHYVRVFADPLAPVSQEDLLAVAGRVDLAIVGQEGGDR
jgi:hypothetical protein